MFRCLFTCALLGGIPLVLAGCNHGPAVEPGSEGATTGGAESNVEIGNLLYTSTMPPGPMETPAPSGVVDPIVVGSCHLVAFEKQDVPSEKDGIIESIDVKEGDLVKPGQLLGRIKDNIPKDEVAIAEAKVTAAQADVKASEGTRDEAKARYDRSAKLLTRQAESIQDADAERLTYIRYYYESINKAELVKLAERELNKAKTTLKMYEIRSSIPGVVKTIFKKKGEAVKSAPGYEPIFQILNLSHLRAEGMVEKQFLPVLRKGKTTVRVEEAESEGPTQTLVGHLQEVTGVAVTKDGKLIVSASADGTLRVWDRATRSEKRVLRNPTAPGIAVKAVACTGPGAEANLCLAGTADGKVSLWDLSVPFDQPIKPLVFKDQHRRAVTCVAFTPDGKYCVTGGDDKEICLWNTATGELRYRFPASHNGAVTSLQFTPQSQLISTGRDNTIRLWTVGEQGARLETTIDRRSGDVSDPGVSPDGRRMIYDQGKTLRLLSLPDGLTRGVLENSSGANNFSTFAKFSPDGRLILTAGASEGRLQLWQAPTGATRGSEVRQLVSTERSPATCATFAPDGSFIVTGNRDRQVQVWPVPTKEEVDRPLTAELTLVEQSVESEGRKVRIWAELQNPENRLLPGDTVTLVIYPKE